MQFNNLLTCQREKQNLEEMAANKKVALQLSIGTVTLPKYETKFYSPLKGKAASDQI